jgi:hypothetical protein
MLLKPYTLAMATFNQWLSLTTPYMATINRMWLVDYTDSSMYESTVKREAHLAQGITNYLILIPYLVYTCAHWLHVGVLSLLVRLLAQ